MEEKKDSSPVENPETIIPTVDTPTPHSLPPYVHDEIRSTAGNSSEPDEKKPALAQRLAEAFREGVASAKPDCDERPDVRIPPPVKKNRQKTDDTGVLDSIPQDVRSAAAIVGDKAASALDAIFQLAKKAPAVTQKYAEAFREGASSVKPREGRERGQELPPSAAKNWLPSGGGVILDRLLQAGGSAAGIVRDAISTLVPGEAGGAGHKICIGKKKMDNLYIEIGREVVTSWDSGSIETEKISELLKELRKNEEEIQNLQEGIAKTAAKGKTERSGRRQAAEETVVTPISNKEDGDLTVSVSESIPEGQVYHLGDRQQEGPEGVDLAVAETAPFPAQEAESPASTPAPASAVEEEAVPPTPPLPEPVVEGEPLPGEEASGDGSDQATAEESEATREEREAEPPARAPVPESAVEAEPAPREEEVTDGSDQAPSREPDARLEKLKLRPLVKGRRGGKAPSGQKRGRR